MVELPLTVKAVPTILAALKPFDTSNDPAKLDEPVPEKVALVAVKPFDVLREPEKELLAVPYDKICKVEERLPAAWMPLVTLRLPAKEDEPVPEKTAPPPATTPPVTLSEPEKELEATPVERNTPEVVRLPVAWTPLVTSRPPEKELEPVLILVMMPARVRVPETEAVPPTSRLVSVELPELMPRRPVLDVSSKLPEPEAFTNEKRPV